jgi:lipoyl synthase
MKHSPKPEWLKTRLAGSGRFSELRHLLTKLNLNTVCTEASCPNIGECWKMGSVTVMILGKTCSRNCRFCNVNSSKKPEPPDPEEPEHVAEALSGLSLNHTVITSVTRDDLKDGGSRHWASTISAVKNKCKTMTMEALIPDFKFNVTSLNEIMEAGPHVLSHNLETVKRLAPKIRPQASHDGSLMVLKRASSAGAVTKSGLMLGLGETKEEIIEEMKELRDVGVRIVTLGQYLQPSRNHLPVARYVHPDEFQHLAVTAKGLGFDCVESGPLVRSSYRAARQAHLCKK